LETERSERIMRGGRFRLIRIVAFILVIGLAFFSLLLSSSGGKAVNADINVPQGFARVADLARPRHEVRIERALKLDELMGFNPDLASLLRTPRERQPSDDSQRVEQLASLSPERGRDSAR
jgi:hypothetical protein